MRKVPVGATIAHGYGFLVRRALTILGLSWLPAIFYAAAAGFWIEKLSSALLLAPHNGSINDFQLGDVAGFAVVTALTSAILGVALTHDAAERSSRGVAAYFVIAIRERKLFVARLEAYALSLIAALIAAIVVRAGVPLLMSAIGQRVWLGVPAETYAVVCLCLIGFFALATVGVRFDFFSGPQVVAEEHAKLSRNWTLSRGNFWRLLIVELFLLAPFLIALAVGAWAIGQSGFRGAVFSFAHDPSRLYQWVSDNAAGVAVAFSVGIVVLNALFAGASAAAYSVIQSLEQDAPEEAAPYFAESDRAFADYRPRAETMRAVERRYEPEAFIAEASIPENTISMPQFPLASEELAEQASVAEEPLVSQFAQAPAIANDQIEQNFVSDNPVADDVHSGVVPEPEADVKPIQTLLSQADVAEAQVAAPATVPIEAHEPAPQITPPKRAEGVTLAERLQAAAAMETTPPPASPDAMESSRQSVPSEAV
jgi:hypothetical protein